MTYEELKKEVKIVHNLIKEIAKQNEEIDNKFAGTQIMFSQLEALDKNKPKILLLGINPGWGYWQKNNVIVGKFDEQKELEYKDGEYDLAKNIKSFFIDYCKMEDLFKTNVLKSNFFYFATENFSEYKALTKKLLEIEEFKNCANSILKQKEKNPLFCLAKRWTKALIEDIIKPDIIICDGKTTNENYLINAIKNDDCGFKINFDKDKSIFLSRTFSTISNEEKEKKCKELKLLFKDK